jgi:G-protein alpha subunit
MGCSASKPVHIINSVDQELLDAQEVEKYHHKILLLGAGESGKSTVVKQIKMIWRVGGGPSDKEKQEYILAIRRNAIEAIQTLLEVSEQNRRHMSLILQDALSTVQLRLLLGVCLKCCFFVNHQPHCCFSNRNI